MVTSNNGTSMLCKQNVEHRSIVKHLHKCLAKEVSSNTSEKEKIFLIKVYTGKSFWLFIEINGSDTLETLDLFLRDTWLECYGHMSEFKLHGEAYSIDGGMEKKIHRIFNIGDEFDYAYDFGSTTELKGKIISVRTGKLLKKIRLLARNNLPEDIKCKICQKHPEVICSVCYDLFCKKCKTAHNCEGEEFMLPVVNSPRMGVCGYTGMD